MKNLFITNNSLFNFLPHYFGVKNIETKDDIYTMALDIVYISTNFATQFTECAFEDYDDEREEAIEFVMSKIIEQNPELKSLGFESE